MQFSPIRFQEDPLSKQVYAITRMTWGSLAKLGYHDFWVYTGEVKRMTQRTTARPVTSSLQEV